MKTDHLPTEAGIYAIVNRANGHRYVGQAKNIRSRIGEHVRDLREGRHFAGLKRRLLQDAWNVLGEEVFEPAVLEIVRDNKGEYPYAERADNLSLAEHYFIDERSEYNPDKSICAAKHRPYVEALAWREPPRPQAPPTLEEAKHLVESMTSEQQKALTDWMTGR